MKIEEKNQEKLGEALMKVALGYQVAEVTEEFAEVDGELKLTKRKSTKKDVPPDLKAVQMLLATNCKNPENLTDEELEEEKKALLILLENKLKEKANTEEIGGQVFDELNIEQETIVKKQRKIRAKPRKRVVRKKED